MWLPARPEHTAAADLPALQQWHEDHATDPPLHTGDEILRSLHSEFTVHPPQYVAGLWIYLSQWLDDTDHGGEVAARLRSLEHGLLTARAIAAVGLRFTAHLTTVDAAQRPTQ